MSKPVERIKALMCNLPERDIPLGHKFLNERDFESLKELVDSAIYRVEKSLASGNPREEYLKVNLEDLNVLKSEVDTYIVQIGIPEDGVYVEDFEDNDNEEEEYY